MHYYGLAEPSQTPLQFVYKRTSIGHSIVKIVVLLIVVLLKCWGFIWTCVSADLGGLNIVEMLFSSSLLAIVGTGEKVPQEFLLLL
jgi:hypothetical protein